MNKNQFKDIIKNKFREKLREKPRRNQRETQHDNNNHAEIKIYVTGDFMVYFHNQMSCLQSGMWLML